MVLTGLGARGRVMTYTAVIADDDALVRHVLRCALEQRGYSVREAADGEALLNCTGSDIDLVLMDASMPGSPLGERLGRMRAVAPHGRPSAVGCARSRRLPLEAGTAEHGQSRLCHCYCSQFPALTLGRDRGKTRPWREARNP